MNTSESGDQPEWGPKQRRIIRNLTVGPSAIGLAHLIDKAPHVVAGGLALGGLALVADATIHLFGEAERQRHEDEARQNPGRQGSDQV